MSREAKSRSGPPARHPQIEYALSNRFGLGGVNASVILRRSDENPVREKKSCQTQ